MRNIFSQKDKKIKDAKELLLEVFFNPEKQKDAVARAAKESAEDQRAMLRKANEDQKKIVEQYRNLRPKTTP